MAPQPSRTGSVPGINRETCVTVSSISNGEMLPCGCSIPMHYSATNRGAVQPILRKSFQIRRAFLVMPPHSASGQGRADDSAAGCPGTFACPPARCPQGRGARCRSPGTPREHRQHQHSDTDQAPAPVPGRKPAGIPEEFRAASNRCLSPAGRCPPFAEQKSRLYPAGANLCAGGRDRSARVPDAASGPV